MADDILNSPLANIIPPDQLAKIAAAADRLREKARARGLPDDWAHEFLPRILPPQWQEITERTYDGTAYGSSSGLCVIVTASVEDDDKRWLHVSLSYRDKLPTWNDIKHVKNVFIGHDRVAYQIFPQQKNYVNIHKFTLHLYSCLDGDPLPDFTGGTGSI